MVLTCMDFRLLDDVTRLMDAKGYTNNYDGFILAGYYISNRYIERAFMNMQPCVGASLGVNQTKYPEWAKSWETHLGLAQELHHVSEVICIDHENCGAYKKLYEKAEIPLAEENKMHEANLRQFRDNLKSRIPKLKISLYIMKLDGTVVDIN